MLTFVAIATLANATLVGFASYKGLEVMDSVGFCGEACHTVMAPELAAYKGSPHSRIGCVECHIGDGAGVVREVEALGDPAGRRGRASRPIRRPSPPRSIISVPPRETCEQCHWPQRFTGDRVLIKRKYAEDEKNTQLTTVLVMHVGGAERAGERRHPRPAPRLRLADQLHGRRRAAAADRHRELPGRRREDGGVREHAR